MSIEDSINSAAEGTAKTALKAGETIKSAVNLDPVETTANLLDTGVQAASTVVDTIFSIFD